MSLSVGMGGQVYYSSSFNRLAFFLSLSFLIMTQAYVLSVCLGLPLSITAKEHEGPEEPM